MSSTPDDESIELQRERYQSILRSLSEAPKFTKEWFRLKEEELSLRGLMTAETVAPRRAANGSSLHAPSTLTGSIESIPDGTDHPLPYPSLQWSTNPIAKEQIDYEAGAAKKDAANGISLHAPVTRTGSIESIPDDADHPLPYPSLQWSTNPIAKEQIDYEAVAAKKDAASGTPTIGYGTQAITMKGKPVVELPKKTNSSHAKNMKDVRYRSISDDFQTFAAELRDSNLQSTAIANSRFIDYPSHVHTRPVLANSEIVVTEAFPVTDEIIRIDVPPHETATIPSAEVVVLDMYSVTIAGRKIHVIALALAVLTLLSLIVGLSVYAALSNKNDSVASASSVVPPTSSRGNWAFCTTNSQCDNNCCSKEYSTSDVLYKCTPNGTQCTGILLGDWGFCTVNSECSNNCCSKEYSTSDGKYKCTPSGTQCTGILRGDWEFCTTNTECDNNCCSKEYSTSDGKYKCTPGGTQCTGILQGDLSTLQPTSNVTGPPQTAGLPTLPPASSGSGALPTLQPTSNVTGPPQIAGSLR